MMIQQLIQKEGHAQVIMIQPLHAEQLLLPGMMMISWQMTNVVDAALVLEQESHHYKIILCALLKLAGPTTIN